ncbi:MAG: hypothetical protein HFH68_00265 [Lachnospiraceae bacterium]|nr:hypothetical protein [Lachnospiraceae bacterium]
MEINKDTLKPFIIFNKGVVYNSNITLYPIQMKDILSFQQYQPAFTVRKNAIFHEKEIIKMEYLDFLKYACRNIQLAQNYNMPFLPLYYDFAIKMLELACGNGAKIEYSPSALDFTINGFLITSEVFDDLRKIIILQNDIDFNTDEFMNIDTVNALEKAREFEANKNKDKADIEDYIDSLAVALKVTGGYVSRLPVRKFWRYIKRINKHDEYNACRSGQMSGLVTFKEPLSHWMTSIETSGVDSSLIADEEAVRNKIG